MSRYEFSDGAAVAPGLPPRVVTPSREVHNYLLALVLFLRAADHGIYALWTQRESPGWLDVFHRGALFGVTDGILGLAVAGLLVPLATSRAPRLIATLTLLDALGRLGIGVMLELFPGIPITAVTIVPFFALVAACAALLGITVMCLWLVERFGSGTAWSRASDALFDPLGVAALLSYYIAYHLFTDPPASTFALRMMIERSGSLMAVVFLVAALGGIFFHGHAAEQSLLVP